MVALLTLLLDSMGCDEFDMEAAIYWLAADYHGGQGSNLYSALSQSPYTPSPLENGPRDGAKELYDTLRGEFA
jgi:hypothetical protein